MRTSLALITLPIVLVVACSENTNPGDDPASGGSAGARAGSTSGTANNAGSSSANGGAASGAAGTTSSGGSNAGGTTAGRGGAGAASGAGGTGTSGTGGSGGSGGTAGTGGATSAGAGGTTAGSGGAGGSAVGGAGASSGGSGGGDPGVCTREVLRSAVDAYFVALAAHDPSTLPLADTVKFTENGEELELGSAGLWETAGEVKYSHSALDVEVCTAASQGVVPDGNTDIPFALRLKLEAGQITEIETIAVRSGDYPPLSSNTAALIASDDSVNWEEPVPASAEPNSHEEIVAWMNKYFRVFPQGVCNVASSCRRIENGGGTFNCSTGASCAAGEPGPDDDALVPRLILADVETGMGVGFTMFTTGGRFTDMHMFKMYGDQVYGVSAVLGTAADSGWD